jgi:hypothetical protein
MTQNHPQYCHSESRPWRERKPITSKKEKGKRKKEKGKRI